MKRLPVSFCHVVKYDDGSFGISSGLYDPALLGAHRPMHEARKESYRRDGVTYNQVQGDFITFIDSTVKVEPIKEGGPDAV
jgi:hypothetical protein